MAILKAKAQQDTSVARVSEGADVFLRSTRDGAMFAADWKQALILEGRGFMVNLGALVTGVDGGGTGSVCDLDCPSAVIGIPSGTSILPMRIGVAINLPVGAADDNVVNVLIAVDQDKMNASSSGTSTAETIYNINTLHPRGSACYANSVYTATMTDPVLDIELAHFTKVFELFSTAGTAGQGWTNVDFLYEPRHLPIINGPAMLILYFGGTATTAGFADIQWLELPTSLI